MHFDAILRRHAAFLSIFFAIAAIAFSLRDDPRLRFSPCRFRHDAAAAAAFSLAMPPMPPRFRHAAHLPMLPFAFVCLFRARYCARARALIFAQIGARRYAQMTATRNAMLRVTRHSRRAALMQRECARVCFFLMLLAL